jgi:hypothetical protein
LLWKTNTYDRKMVSTGRKTISAAGKLISTGRRVFSARWKTISTGRKVISARRKAIAVAGEVISTGGKVVGALPFRPDSLPEFEAPPRTSAAQPQITVERDGKPKAYRYVLRQSR